jgi:hypothetical protein
MAIKTKRMLDFELNINRNELPEDVYIDGVRYIKCNNYPRIDKDTYIEALETLVDKLAFADISCSSGKHEFVVRDKLIGLDTTTMTIVNGVKHD